MSKRKPINKKVLSSKIEDLDLSVLAKNRLQCAGIENVSQLICYCGRDLLRIKNFGRKSLREVKEALESFALSLREDGDGTDWRAKPLLHTVVKSQELFVSKIDGMTEEEFHVLILWLSIKEWRGSQKILKDNIGQLLIVNDCYAVKGRKISLIRRDRPLCPLYYNETRCGEGISCENCVIAKHTGVLYCYCTPYKAVCDALREYANQKPIDQTLVYLFDEERRFLESYKKLDSQELEALISQGYTIGGY